MSTPTEELPPTQAVPEGTKPITRYTAEHGREVGLPSPEAINYMMSVAKLITSTALIGKDMGLSKEQKAELLQAGFTQMEIYTKNQEAIVCNAFAKMLYGHELNPAIPPLLAQSELDIVKGKIFVRYQQVVSMIEAKGYQIEEIERSKTRAAIKLLREGYKERTFEFTIEDANEAGLNRRGYNNEPSQYELRPRVMLWSRLMSETNRAIGNRGVYTHEEREEIETGLERRDNGAFQQPEQAMGNPFKAVQRPALEAGAEPINLRPNQPEKEPAVKSASGISGSSHAEAMADKVLDADGTVLKNRTGPTGGKEGPTLVDPSKGKGPRSHAKAESNPVPAILPTKETHEPDDRSDWLPENLGGTPTQAQRREDPMPAPSQRDRMVSIGTELARLGNRNPKAIQACVQQWIMAFANLTTYKLAPQEAYNIPLDFLEPEAKREGLAILQDPHGMGLKAGAGWNELIRYIDKYGPEFKAACKKAAVAHLSDNPAMLTDLIEAAQEEGPLPEGDLVALLSIYTIAPALTTKFQAHAGELGTSMQELFAALPSQTEAGILTLLAGGKKEQPELWRE